MELHIKTLLLVLLCILQMQVAFAQDCPQPVVNDIEPLNSSSAHIDWFVSNGNLVDFWEIELIKKGESFSGNPTVSDIPFSEHIYTGLEQGLDYSFNIRSQCPMGTSTWNGPYFFATDIESTGNCELSLELKDNNCPSMEVFRVNVEGYEDRRLGDDLFLTNISFIIDHPWPPDLLIQLQSPDDQWIDLSVHKGLYARNFGDPSDDNCERTVSFSDLACEGLQEFDGKLIGSYLPENPINSLYQGQSPTGIWHLHICDRAKGDEGLIKHVSFEFNQQACEVPGIKSIAKVSDREVQFVFDNPNCEDIRFSYGPMGFDPLTGTSEFVSCDSSSYTIVDLIPDTEYDFYINGVCLNQPSPFSCPYEIRTKCSPPQDRRSFDNEIVCDNDCQSNCELEGSWFNVAFDDLDWKVQAGSTPTLFTGPDIGIHNFGHYIYLENQTEICGVAKEAILSSSCLAVESTNQSCDLSFNYHMNGIGVSELRLEILEESASEWSTIWMRNGAQNRSWNFEYLDLSAYDGTLIRLRFVASTGENNFGDIALDEISMMGLRPLGDGIAYYKDSDNDGFGDPEDNVIICSSNPIPNHVEIAGDCNDNDGNINPEMPEIKCNLIDENCNGMEDDEGDLPIIASISGIVDESCLGAADGSITVVIDQGTGPYSFTWSNESQDSLLQNIQAGFYSLEINDAAGCLMILDSIGVGFESSIQFTLSAFDLPSCLGSQDGKIGVLAGNGTQPYHYEWSNQQEGNTIDSLESGFYSLTITDAMGCQLITEPFDLNASSNLNAGIKWIEPILCHGDADGWIEVQATGGEEPIHYEWSTGHSGPILESIAKGLYNVTITDNGGCQQVIEDIEMPAPKKLEILVDNIENNLCFGEQDGSIQISTIGGSPPYSFIWNNGELTDDISNLEAGFYSLTVSDINGCSITQGGFLIEEPDPLIISIDTISAASCDGSNDGKIQISTTGGNGDYLYLWSDTSFINTNQIDTLSPGQYAVTVVDALGCKQDIQNIQIQSEGIHLDVMGSVLTPLVCFGDSTAIANIQIDTAELPVQINWDFGKVAVRNTLSFNETGLFAGEHMVTITDSKGCTGVTSVSIMQPEPINIDQILKQENQCYGEEAGTISLEVSGGSGSYTYTWFHGDNGSMIEGLANGEYMAIITDENFCQTVTDPIYISSPDSFYIEATINNSSSANDGIVAIFPFGGEEPYRFKWDDATQFTSNNQFTNLSPGFYSASIRDHNECQIDTLFEVQLIISNEQQPLKDIGLYPNPSSDKIYLTNVEKITRVSVFDMEGKQYYLPIEYSVSDISLHTLTLPSGSYFIRLESTNEKAVLKRFVKL